MSLPPEHSHELRGFDSARLLVQSCYYTFDKQLDSLKQLRVMCLAQGYFDSSCSFILFNPVWCGGGISRFKSRWEEFCWKISNTHARTYHNQRISLRLKNRLFLSHFPRANLTCVWCRFGANNGLDYNEVGLFEVSPWLLVQMNSIWYLQHPLWISPPAPQPPLPTTWSAFVIELPNEGDF